INWRFRFGRSNRGDRSRGSVNSLKAKQGIGIRRKGFDSAAAGCLPPSFLSSDLRLVIRVFWSRNPRGSAFSPSVATVIGRAADATATSERRPVIAAAVGSRSPSASITYQEPDGVIKNVRSDLSYSQLLGTSC
ncbi:unnamed protein product, partial [Musa acuminata var. zebrina]